MKSFLIKLFVFLLPVSLFIVFVEMQLRSIPNIYSVKKEQLDKLSQGIEILCLGSSHTFYGINPVYFSMKGYNAACISQTFDYDKKILEKYIHAMPALRYVIIPVSYFSFFDKIAENKENWRLAYYSLSMQLEKPNIFSDYMIFNSVRQDLVPYWLGHGNPVPVNEAGYGTDYSFDKRNKNLDKTGAVRAKLYTMPNLGLHQEEMKNHLEDMIRLCESRNITVVLLVPPAHQSYREHLNQQQLSLMYSLIDSVRQQHKNVIFYDALLDPEYVTDDFCDADHLNEYGAEKLTERIDQLLQN